MYSDAQFFCMAVSHGAYTEDHANDFNPLRAKFFRGNIKYMFTFYVIPPHLYDTGG